MKKYEKYIDSGIEWIGEIPEEWNVVKLKRIAKIQTGNTPSTNNLKYWENGIVDWYTPGDFSEDTILLDSSNKKVSYIAVEEKSCRLFKRGTVLLVGIGATLGKVGYCDKDCSANQQINAISFDEHVLNIYGTYFLKAARNYIISMSNSSTLPILNQYSTGEIEILLPPISEQQAIADFLDNKVSLINKSISSINVEIDNLKKYRQSLISETVTKGLNPNVKMKDSGIEWIGEIPENWEIIPLKYNLSLKGRIGWNGLKSDEFEKESYAYLVTGQDFGNDVVDWSKCYQINKERYEEDPFIQLKNGDLLVTKDGTIGKVAKVMNLDKPACLNSGIFVVKQTGDRFVQGYLYWLFVSNQLKEFVNYYSTGSTIQHLYQNVFENMPLIIPSL